MLLLNPCKKGVQEMFHLAGHIITQRIRVGIQPSEFLHSLHRVRSACMSAENEVTRSLGATSASVSRPAARMGAAATRKVHRRKVPLWPCSDRNSPAPSRALQEELNRTTASGTVRSKVVVHSLEARSPLSVRASPTRCLRSPSHHRWQAR